MNKEKTNEGIDPTIIKQQINEEGFRGDGKYGEDEGNAAMYTE